MTKDLTPSRDDRDCRRLLRIPLPARRAITMLPSLAILAAGVNPTSALVLSQVVLSFGIPLAPGAVPTTG